MGLLYYGDNAIPLVIEDRALAHVKVVVTAKLRRNESFTLSWVHPEGEAPGRSTIWLSPAIPLKFVFENPEPPRLNPAWLDQLAASASGAGVITLIPETTGPLTIPTEES